MPQRAALRDLMTRERHRVNTARQRRAGRLVNSARITLSPRASHGLQRYIIDYNNESLMRSPMTLRTQRAEISLPYFTGCWCYRVATTPR